MTNYIQSYKITFIKYIGLSRFGKVWEAEEVAEQTVMGVRRNQLYIMVPPSAGGLGVLNE